MGPHPLPSRLYGPVGVVVSLLLRLGYTLRAADGASVSGPDGLSPASLAVALLHLGTFPRPGSLVALNVHAPPVSRPPFALAPCVVWIAEAHMPVNSAGHAYQPPASSPDAASPEPLGPLVESAERVDGRIRDRHAADDELDPPRIPLATLAAVGTVASGSLAVDASFLLASLWPGGRLAAGASPRERDTHAFLSRVLALRDFVAPPAVDRPPPVDFDAPARTATRSDTARTLLALRVLDTVEAWIAERRVSCPESLLQVDDVNQSLPDFAESLASLVGWHRDTSDLDDDT